MVLNQEENPVLGVQFVNGCFKEECSDVVGKNYKSEKGSEDNVHVLPNDPFCMEFSKGLNGDAIGMDVNFSLPKDPFDMNFGIETTVSAINDWIEDFGLKKCSLETNEEDKNDDDEKLIRELNLVWASSVQFELEEGESENVDGNEADVVIHAMDESTFDECHLMVGSAKELMCFGFEKYQKEHVRDSCSEAELSLCGCDNLSIDLMLQDLRIFNSLGMPGIKNLRISDHFGIMNHHLKEFKLLLGVENEKKAGSYKPRLYREGQRYLSLDDERAIDIELCPRCDQVRQVYDCPLKSCQANPDSTQTCKACIACVDRCIKCGCCLDNTDYEETFCLDLVCLDCLTQLLDCQGRMRFFPAPTCFDGKTGYHIVFCG